MSEGDRIEKVTIDVSITCAGCRRVLIEHADLDGDSLRTGNFTQRAAYWLDSMNARLNGEIKRRTWDKTDNGHWRCAHCRAAEIDRLAKVEDPIEP